MNLRREFLASCRNEKIPENTARQLAEVFRDEKLLKDVFDGQIETPKSNSIGGPKDIRKTEGRKSGAGLYMPIR